MSTQKNSLNPSKAKLESAWRVVTAAYSRVNRVTHHALGWLLLLLTILYFAFCFAFLSLRYVVLPNIDAYKPQVEQLASRFIQRPVTIDAIQVNWSGLNPRLKLEQLVIYDQAGAKALTLPAVSATVSWLTVLGELRLSALEFVNPDLEIERDAQGQIFVAGLLLDTRQSNDGRAIDWLLAQREVMIRDGRLRWRDGLRAAPDLTLTSIDFLLQNQWRSHRLALKATPPAAMSAPLELRAEFVHPAFATSSSDYKQWSGEVFLDWQRAHLDAWKQYLDLPWELHDGTGTVRTWIGFRRGVVENVTADLALNELSVKLGPNLDPLKLVEVSGRIGLGEVNPGLKDRLLGFGEHGHALTLTDFSLRTDRGSVLPRTTASHIYSNAVGSRPAHHELKITELDLEALAGLAAHLPLSDIERQMLYEFAPRGELKNFSATWDGDLPGAGKYKASGHFERLSIKPQMARVRGAGQEARDALPGFDNVSGDIEASEEGGRLRVSSQNSTLYLAPYLASPTLFFDELLLDSSWSLRDPKRLGLKVANFQFSQAGLKGKFEGSHSLPWPLDANQLGEIDVKGAIESVELTRLAGLMPPVTGPETREWMAEGLLEGRADEVELLVKGNLNKFPFTIKHPSDKPEGMFRITAKIHHGRINPAPKELAQDRRTPLWPWIDEVEGKLHLERARLLVKVDTARTQGLPLSAVEVVIPDYMSPSPVLEVSGSVGGALQTMLAYVNATPVVHWIEGLTEEARATGNAKLGLKLQLPLVEGGTQAVQGHLHFSGNEVQLWRSLPTVQQLQGDLAFTDKGFQLNNLQGMMLGGPLSITGGTQRDLTTQVRLDGSVTAEGISRFMPTAAAKRFMRRVSGSSRYSASVRVRNQRTEITLDSSLAGLALDLPAPLQKAATDVLPLKVLITPMASDSTLQAEDLRFTLGRSLVARYQRQRSNQRNAPWKMVRGGIGVNSIPLLSDSGLTFSANLPSVNLDAWRSLASNLTAERGQTESGSSSQDLASFIEPDTVSLRATELRFADRLIKNALIGGSRSRAGWQFNVHSDQVIGHATWEDPLSERGAGKVSARLTQLRLEKNAVNEAPKVSSENASFKELPGLDIVAENFELDDLKLGRLELVATNAGLAVGVGREWRISRLNISNPDATMRANGRWLTATTDSQTSLNYELEIADAGRLLDRFGFERTLKGGKGKMEGDIGWRGAPSSLDFPSLSGNLSLKIAAGQFLKADPGVAKLLGVMSLQALPRRLTLDFRDMFSEGFQFDSIASTATLKRGTLKTDSFKMRGVNAVVLMDGTVDLNEETQNLDVVVVPELNAGGASVVYGLAVNPVIGLGSFLAQLFLKNPLSQALTQEYQISGPWKDPVIKKVSGRRRIVQDADNPKDSGKAVIE